MSQNDPSLTPAGTDAVNATRLYVELAAVSRYARRRWLGWFTASCAIDGTCTVEHHLEAFSLPTRIENLERLAALGHLTWIARGRRIHTFDLVDPIPSFGTAQCVGTVEHAGIRMSSRC